MRGDGRVTAQSTAAHGAIGIAAIVPMHVELPSQYADRHGANAIQLQPEKRLMLRVLEDAVETYQKYAFARDPRGKALYREAAAWIASDARDWLYDFARICDALGLGTDYLRRGLEAWEERQQASGRVSAADADVALVTLARLRALGVPDGTVADACRVSIWTVRSWRMRRFRPDAQRVRLLEALLVESEQQAPPDEARVLLHGLRGRGWSYRAIAEALGLRDTSISLWARGRATPTAANLTALRDLAASSRAELRSYAEPRRPEAAAC